jgi:hypothetical protein
VKNIAKIVYLLFSILFLTYLLIPNISFPNPPSDSLQSREPADTETPLRRAYFTNSPRQEVMNHYENEFKKSYFINVLLPSYRLNYPPEEAQIIIRDQTRSTFLEEVVHPFRESLFVNGFEPKEEKDTIFIESRNWRQKITVRYVPSNVWIRFLLGVLAIVLILVLYREWLIYLKRLLAHFKNA